MIGTKHTPEHCANNSAARRDKTIYMFKHKDGAVFTGTPYDFRTKHGLAPGHLSYVVNGKNKTIKGWQLCST